MARNGVRIELEEASRKNLEKNLEIIKAEYPAKLRQMVVKLGYDMKFLAQQKLKGDRHIVTSRLRNSIFVKTFDKRNERRIGNEESYTYGKVTGKDKAGKPIVQADTLTGRRSLDDAVIADEGDVAMGTNVEYASKIEFQHDSFIYWAAKHVDIRKRVSQLAKELKEIRFVK